QPMLGELGVSTRAGTEVLERQYKFRVVLGPMPRAKYERFLPQGDLMPRVVALVTRYVGTELAWDVRLTIEDAELQPTVLGRSGRIGQTSYIGDPSQMTATSQDQLVLDPIAAGC
ncbi:MAG TPA: type VI secretion system baseplate subunit TssG, partial [Polyangiales bacterium]|nr:type VI secretion system baseplate subunit TssG [Polyangiales bacterium]